jgi:hypothetical protein
VFALFIVSVLMLFLISLFSFTQQQSQTASVRPETATWLAKARQQQGRFAMPKNLFCSRGTVVPDLGDQGMMMHRNLSENQEVLARVTHGRNPVLLRGEVCSRI